jgi:hypothetical protein
MRPREVAKILKAEGSYGPKTTVYYIEFRVRRLPWKRSFRRRPDRSPESSSLASGALKGRNSRTAATHAGIRSQVPGRFPLSIARAVHSAADWNCEMSAQRTFPFINAHTCGGDTVGSQRKSRAVDQREEVHRAPRASDRHLSTASTRREGHDNSGKDKECSQEHPGRCGGDRAA